MHCNWINGMKTLSLAILIIFILSFKQNQVKAAVFDVDDGHFEDLHEAVKRAGGWQNLQGGWGKRNNEIAVDYRDKTSADYVDLGRNYDDDTSKVDNINGEHWNYDYGKSLEEKRSRPANWNNLNNAGWGKREPGQWNNLRGLWGKRSSWGKLHGGWGR